jgi:hypothetical protein
MSLRLLLEEDWHNDIAVDDNSVNKTRLRACIGLNKGNGLPRVEMAGQDFRTIFHVLRESLAPDLLGRTMVRTDCRDLQPRFKKA